MEDVDNSTQSSKKRAARVQLTRDDPDLDDNEQSSEMEGTFKKASDEVLATRRIVKVRRQQSSTTTAAPAPSPASNPFAAVSLVPSASSAPPVKTEAHSGKPENKIDELKGESIAEHEKTDGTDDGAKQSGSKIVDSKARPDAVENEGNDASKEDVPQSIIEVVSEGANLDDGVKKAAAADNSETEPKKAPEGKENNLEKENDEGAREGENPDDGVKQTEAADNSETESKNDSKGEGKDKQKGNVEELTESGNRDDGVKKSTAADDNETESKKNVEDEGEDKNKENVEETGEKNAEPAFGLFQRLSNSQNAFSGLTGTGFSSTSFSFGTANKDEHSLGSGNTPLFGLNSDRPPAFGFGPSTNGGGSSIFGTSGANASNNEGSKFPPKPEVPIETGEENEKSAFTADSVLFEFIDGSWKERGKGEVKVNVPTTGTGKARLVMRAKGNYRLILNASLFPDMKLTNMDKKGITFACVNSASEGKEGLSTVALRFKDASIVEAFQAVVTEYKSKTPPALNTPENSPKADETS